MSIGIIGAVPGGVCAAAAIQSAGDEVVEQAGVVLEKNRPRPLVEPAVRSWV